MTLQEAYQAWVDTFPNQSWIGQKVVTYQHPTKGFQYFVEISHWDGDCCKNGHRVRDVLNRSWRRLKDEECCARDLAWRIYVRIRDGRELQS